MSNTSSTTTSKKAKPRRKVGVRAEFEVLWGQVSAELKDFTQRLHEHTDNLPEWIEVDGAELRAHFYCPEGPPFHRAMIGPGAVKLAAGQVEALLADSPSARMSPGQVDLEDDVKRIQFAAAVAEFLTFLDAVESQTEVICEDGRGELEAVFDALLEAVEAQREADVLALETLVHEGELDAGRDSQPEIANLWEDQRRRFEEMERCWAPIGGLLDEALDYTRARFAELRDLLDRAQHAPAPPPQQDLPLGTHTSVTHTSVTEPAIMTAAEVLEAVEVEEDVAEVDEPEEVEEAEEIEEHEPKHPSVQVPCLRVRLGWKAISRLEVGLVIGLPGLVVGVAALMGLLHLAGVGPNPMHIWRGMPILIGVALAWTLLAPLGLKWRSVWRGLRVGFVREAAVVDEGDVSLTGERLSVNRTSFARRDIKSVTLKRWESPLDAAMGWLLVIEPPYHAPLHLAAGESDEERWSASEAACVAAPVDAWQLEEADFELLREFLVS